MSLYQKRLPMVLDQRRETQQCYSYQKNKLFKTNSKLYLFIIHIAKENITSFFTLSDKRVYEHALSFTSLT